MDNGNSSNDAECSKCARKSEDYRCPSCGQTGHEIYIARWEATHNASHPDNWQIPVE